jgi:hypothetical protein
MSPPNFLVPDRFHDPVDASQGSIAAASFANPLLDFIDGTSDVNGADMHAENIKPRDPAADHRNAYLLGGCHLI